MIQTAADRPSLFQSNGIGTERLVQIAEQMRHGWKHANWFCWLLLCTQRRGKLKWDGEQEKEAETSGLGRSQEALPVERRRYPHGQGTGDGCGVVDQKYAVPRSDVETAGEGMGPRVVR